MNNKPSEFSDKPSAPIYPPPDFSIPPPIIQESKKLTETTTKKDFSGREYSRSDHRRNSRDREKSHTSSRPSSSRDSRDYRSQSRYSNSSRYSSSRDYNSRRYEDKPRESSKRKRSRSRSRSRVSSRRSPSHRSTSSRKPSPSNRERTSRSNRSPTERVSRNTREAPRSQRKSSKDPQTERERLLVKWRKNYCETSEQISKKLQELANDEEQASWIRASPADIHYRRSQDNTVESTPRLDALCTLFEDELSKRSEKARTKQDPYNIPLRRRKIRVCRHKCKFETLFRLKLFAYIILLF